MCPWMGWHFRSGQSARGKGRIRGDQAVNDFMSIPQPVISPKVIMGPPVIFCQYSLQFHGPLLATLAHLLSRDT